MEYLVVEVGCVCVMLQLNNDKSACQIHFYFLNRMKLCDESKTKCNSWPNTSSSCSVISKKVQVPNDSSHRVIPVPVRSTVLF
eukprot:scaffold159366_cov61-Attheya_sp.AAC.3